MSNEIQNKQNVSWGKDHWTDASVDDALRQLEGSKKDGVSEQEMRDLLEKGRDYGQITEREYSQIRRWVQANYNSLSPEARKIFEKFDAAMQAAGGAGTAHKHHGTGDKVVLEGAKLDQLMNDIEGVGKHSAPPPPAHNPPSPPPPQPAPPPTATGGSSQGTKLDSWSAIMLALIEMLEKKDQQVKAQANEVLSKGGGNAPKSAEGGQANGTNETGGAKNAEGTDAEGGPEKGDLMRLDQAMKDLNTMFQLVTNIMQAHHDTLKGGINNLRV